VKIAIIANSTWNIYNFRLNILKALEAKGYEITVIAPLDKYIFYLNAFKSVKHLPLKSLSRKSLNPFRDLMLFMEIYRRLRQEKPDLVLHYTVKPNIYGNLAARFLNIPSICAVTGLGYAFIHNGWLQKLTAFLYRISFSSAKKVVFENIDDRLLFEQLGIVKPQNAVSIKGCGIDIQRFIPLEPTNKDPKKTIFTFIGRFLHDKGVKEFVDAAKIIRQKYPQTEFHLIGEIDLHNPATVSEDELLNWVNEKVVVDCGPMSDVRQEIRNSDCIVFPSYREAIARVLQEGMAMEKPIITTDVPGCREAVENEINGFIVPVKNAEKLAECIERFLQLSENQRIEMGKRGREKVVNEFDDRNIAAFFVDLMEKTINLGK
jgi:glycosyltransferase involved in cell wall biosynthesis